MKKHLIFLLVAGLFSLTSCSNDDDNGPDRQDPILGSWTLTEVNPAAIDIDQCEQDSWITFEEDYTGSAVFYIAETDCVATSGEGAWTNEGNDRYSITVPLLGRISGAVEFSGKDTFYFESEDGITLTFERLDLATN